MYLGNPLLPLTLSAEEALKKISEVLKEKNWTDFESGELKLVLIPYFLYTYHYHTQSEENKEAVVKTTKDGTLALNGATLKVEEETVEIIHENLNKLAKEIPQIEHEVKKSLITKSTQEHLLKIKTAEFFSLPKDNVVISGIKQYMIPMFEMFTTIAKENYDISVNAVTGNVYGVDKVPEREKGFMEITKETLNDLKDPKQWLIYTKGLASETRKFLSEKESKEEPNIDQAPKIEKVSILTSKWMYILIIILALFLIYIAFFV